MPSRALLAICCAMLSGCSGDVDSGTPQPVDRGILTDRAPGVERPWAPTREDARAGLDAPRLSDLTPTPDSGCGAECAGCCDEQQTCRAGDSKEACGQGGGRCTSCGASQLCKAGSCCDDDCAGLCGGQLNGCGTPCTTVCPDPCGSKKDCNGTCVDLQSNPSHCGSCDHACPSYSTCIAGACICTYKVCGGYNCCSPTEDACTTDGRCTTTPTCQGAAEVCTSTPNNCCSGTCCTCSCGKVCQVSGMSCPTTCLNVC